MTKCGLDSGCTKLYYSSPFTCKDELSFTHVALSNSKFPTCLVGASLRWLMQRSSSCTHKSENCFSPTMHRLASDCSHHSLPWLSVYHALSLRLINYKQVTNPLTQMNPQLFLFSWSIFLFCFVFSIFQCKCLAGCVTPSWRLYDLLSHGLCIEYLIAIPSAAFPQVRTPCGKSECANCLYTWELRRWQLLLINLEM